MTLKEAAAMLDGREYLNELTADEERRLKEAGIVAVFGQSDDLVELRGAIDAELGAWNGTTIYFDENGLFKAPPCGFEESLYKCSYHRKAKETAKIVSVRWADGAYLWNIVTGIPNEPFIIVKNHAIYCRGLVFEVASLKVTE